MFINTVVYVTSKCYLLSTKEIIDIKVKLTFEWKKFTFYKQKVVFLSYFFNEFVGQNCIRYLQNFHFYKLTKLNKLIQT